MYAKRATFLAALVLLASAWAPLAAAGRGNDGWRNDRHYRSYESSHRGHSHAGAAVGAGILLGASLLWLSSYTPPPQPTRVVVMSSPPPVIFAPPAPRLAPPPPPPEVWYYCRSEGAYYPYVQSCRTPWEVVPAQ